MENNAFLNLGNFTRNIVNIQQIIEGLQELATTKRLDNYPNITKWLDNNVKNYLLQKGQINEVANISDLDPSIQNFIHTKNIKGPYHCVYMDSKVIDTISHCVDYLRSSFPATKDLSRISYPQAQTNAHKWLENKLKKLTGEEDAEFVIPIISVTHNGENYQWVNLRSHKALQREAKMMNNCIESYWEENYQTPEVNYATPYYSLRDKSNKSIITLEAWSEIHVNNLSISEIKEKNNEFLSHTNRPFVSALFEHFAPKENYNLVLGTAEQQNSHFYPVTSDNKIVPQYQSINYFIENNLPMELPKNTLLDVNDFSDYFPMDKLIRMTCFKQLTINQENFYPTVQSPKVTLQKFQDKNITVKAEKILASDISNSTIKINISKPAIYYFENCQNLTIETNSQNPYTWYILKECMGINLRDLSTSNVNILDMDGQGNNYQLASKPQRTPVKIILNSAESAIKIYQKDTVYHKWEILKSNIFTNEKNQIRLEEVNMINQKNKNMLNTVNVITIKNKIMLDTVNIINEIAFDISPEDSLIKKFVKQLEITPQYTKKGLKIYLNKLEIAEDKGEFLLSQLLKAPLDTYQNLLVTEKPKLMVKDIEDFIHTNSYYLLKDGEMTIFPEAQEIIKNQAACYQNILKKLRPVLQNIMNGKDDNLVEYLRELRPIFSKNYDSNGNLDSVQDKEKFMQPLFFYLMKNEFIQQITECSNPENPIKGRISFTEKRLKNFFAKKWANACCDEYEKFTKPELQVDQIRELLLTPFDDNVLLYLLEDKKTYHPKRSGIF